MERWLTYFIIGALFSLFLPKVPELFYLLWLAMSCIGMLFFLTKKSPSAFLAGFCFILLQATYYFSWDQRNNIDQSRIHLSAKTVQGEVLTLTPDEQDRLRFELAMTHLEGQRLASPVNIRLSAQHLPLKINQGDTVSLNVKLKPAHGLGNIAGFSFQKWLLAKRLVLTGYVIRDGKHAIIDKNPSLRQGLYNYIQRAVDVPLKSLIVALALGDKSGISSEQWQVLQQTGTAHLMAISGLHLGLIATLGLFLIRAVIFLLPVALIPGRWGYWLPVIASMLLALCYAFLAGFAIPTLRALLMLAVYWGIRACYGKVTILRWLLLTLFLITVLMPFSLLQPSLYLSLFAVAAILLIIWRFELNHAQDNWLVGTVKSLAIIQLALAVLLLPVSMLLFKQVTLLGLFANIVVVPFLSVSAIPLVLLATLTVYSLPNISLWLFELASWCLQISWRYLEWLQHFELAIIPYSALAFSLMIASCLCLGLYALSLLNGKRSSLLFVTLLSGLSLLGYWQQWQESAQQAWYVSVFDVGHGLAIIVEKDGQAILYDTGATYPSGFSMTESVLMPYLQSRFIDTFAHVIISHQDIDHSGGLRYLLDQQLSNNFYYSFSLPGGREQPFTPCMQGNGFNWQGLTFTMLWPERQVGVENDHSCVVEISDGTHKVLLPGDISALVEHTLLEQGKLGRVDILVAPHHGSKTSSSAEFVEQTRPRYVVYSAGFLNRWHMPVPQVRNRYEQAGSLEFNTATVGMLQFSINSQGIRAKTYRQLQPFWPWLPPD